jgi:hypothetical protein
VRRAWHARSTAAGAGESLPMGCSHRMLSVLASSADMSDVGTLLRNGTELWMTFRGVSTVLDLRAASNARGHVPPLLPCGGARRRSSGAPVHSGCIDEGPVCHLLAWRSGLLARCARALDAALGAPAMLCARPDIAEVACCRDIAWEVAIVATWGRWVSAALDRSQAGRGRGRDESSPAPHRAVLYAGVGLILRALATSHSCCPGTHYTTV